MRVLFGMWYKFELTLANVYGIGQSFIVLKGQILNKSNGHLVTLTETQLSVQCDQI